MRVRDLIAGARWRPGRGYAGATPRVSVLLPTYRRAAGGWFLRAARSVLDQTLPDLELIVVDDASTDGTAAQIDQLMAADDRVSCITHVRNVGLPSISTFEALQRARAPYVAFAFDDFEFDPAALGALADAAERWQSPMVHGFARMVMGARPAGPGAVRVADGSEVHYLGRRGRDFHSYERLRQQNVIPNSGVLLRKDVADVAGWYDPHVMLIRACDHDLWLRVTRRFALDYVPVFVGTEHGPLLSDSLGNSYPVDFAPAMEFMHTDRTPLLTPQAYLDRVVTGCPDGVSTRLRDAIRQAEQAAPASVGAHRPSDTAVQLSDRRVLIVGHANASLVMAFDAAHAAGAPMFWMFSPAEINEPDMETLAGCTAAVFDVRSFLYDQWIDVRRACESMRVPCYFYMDDNLFVVYDETKTPFLEPFVRPQTIQDIRRMRGVIVTSAPLVEAARAYGLHDTVVQVGPALDPVLLPRSEHPAPDAESPLRVAFSGGDHRDGHFLEVVVPALHAIADRRRVTAIVRTDAGFSGLQRICDVENAGTFESFAEFVHRWRAHRPHVLVHPMGRTRNIEFKTRNVVLVAYLLGAVPVLGDEPAYKGLTERDGVIIVRRDTADGWHDALVEVSDPARWRELRSRLAAFCAEEFHPRHNEQVFDRLFAHDAPPDADVLRARRRELRRLLVSRHPWTRQGQRVQRWAYHAWMTVPPRTRQRMRPLVRRLAYTLFRKPCLPDF